MANIKWKMVKDAERDQSGNIFGWEWVICLDMYPLYEETRDTSKQDNPPKYPVVSKKDIQYILSILTPDGLTSIRENEWCEYAELYYKTCPMWFQKVYKEASSD